MKPHALCLAMVLAGSPVVAGVDLTADAVTAATTLNPVVGEVGALFDGRTPDTDPAAPNVMWGGAGLLRVSWPRPVALAKIRVYMGLMERYTVYGYLGGSFSDTGQRQGVEEPLWAVSGLAPLEENLWFDLPCRPDLPIDNLGLSMSGRATLYEVRFLGPDGTAVTPTSYAWVKAAPAH